jgi:hypothetical protein
LTNESKNGRKRCTEHDTWYGQGAACYFQSQYKEKDVLIGLEMTVNNEEMFKMETRPQTKSIRPGAEVEGIICANDLINKLTVWELLNCHQQSGE